MRISIDYTCISLEPYTHRCKVDRGGYAKIPRTCNYLRSRRICPAEVR